MLRSATFQPRMFVRPTALALAVSVLGAGLLFAQGSTTGAIFGRESFWMGLASDDSPLVLRDLGGYQLYALELDESRRAAF